MQIAVADGQRDKSNAEKAQERQKNVMAKGEAA